MSDAPPIHIRAVIISSGDEIILGQLLDTNAQFIARALVSRAIVPIEHLTIPDDLPALVAALRRACAAAPLVIISGGLGPTDGDLTRAALAELTGDQLILDGRAREDIAAMLAKRAREMTERQERQAYRPSRAACLPNNFGTAPGLHLTHAGADIFALPGPPDELAPMLEREVLPRLRPDPARTVVTRLCHIVGMAEADCVMRLGHLTMRTNMPLVGITASGGILTLRIRYEGAAPRQDAEQLVDDAESAARAALGDHLFTSDSDSAARKPAEQASGAGPGRKPRESDAQSTKPAVRATDLSVLGSPGVTRPAYEHLARTVLADLIERRLTIATIESCTGGMLGEMITSVPGSSAAYLGGHITYANTLKEQLGVDPAALQQHGAVSPHVAQQMASRGRARIGADFAVAITGIAGPDGGSAEKPVGTVHIGLATRDTAHSRHFLFTGDREDIRRRAAVTALAMLYFHFRGRAPDDPRLLWEIR